LACSLVGSCMFRQWIASSLILALVLLGTESQLGAQFAQAPQGGATLPDPQAQNPYPQGYPQTGQPPYGNPPASPNDGPNPAQMAPTQQDMAADRQHGVVRLSVADGTVNIQRGDGTGLVAAAANAPLLAQDHLQTGPDARAEVELDFGNVIRVAPNTDVGFVDLEYRRYQLQVGTGSVIYRELRDSGAQVEIDTPSVGIHSVQPGEYRISVYDDGSSQVTVRSGAVDVLSPRGSQSLGAGQSLLVRGNANDPEFQSVAAPAFDQLDGWSRERDQPLLSAQSYRYVNPDVAGAEDLDANGDWVSSQYGPAWEPRDPGPDWSPYSNGNWAYEPYYGWTWVDAAPWGWAPYHYGRWFVNGGRWCWWPGARGVAVGWSPALVGFFGVGAGLGWCALAPFEFGPRWWGGGFGLSLGFGFGGGWGHRGIWGVYRNAGFRGGALYTGRGVFGVRGGRFAPIGRAQLGGATFVGGRLPVSPTRASYSFAARSAFANPRLAAASNRSFFHAQSSGFRSQAGGAFQHAGQGGFNNGARFGGAAGAQGIHGQTPASSNGGWHSFGETGNTSRQNFSHGAEPNSGWHSFGESQHGTPPAQHSYGAPPVHYGTPPQQGYRPNGGGYTGAAPHYQTPAPRSSAPSYQQHYNAPPHYSAPRSPAPGGGGSHYSAPQNSAPHNSAPHGGGGGGGGGGSSHGGGGGHSGGGGGHHR
jgi:hypothetical protein